MDMSKTTSAKRLTQHSNEVFYQGGVIPAYTAYNLGGKPHSEEIIPLKLTVLYIASTKLYNCRKLIYVRSTRNVN